MTRENSGHTIYQSEDLEELLEYRTLPCKLRYVEVV